MITPGKRAKRNALVNQRLAEVVDLLLQVKQAGWNVKRTPCTSLHELFEEIAREVEFFADIMAERIVQLGGIARGTVRTAAVHSRLEEYPLVADNRSQAEAVVWALCGFRRQTRAAIKSAIALEDADTADLFAEICRGIDQWLQFVRTHADASSVQSQGPQFLPGSAPERRLVDHNLFRGIKADPVSGFDFLTKSQPKNQSLRKEVLCQSSITFRLRTAKP